MQHLTVSANELSSAKPLVEHSIDVGPINGVSTEPLKFTFKERNYGKGLLLTNIKKSKKELLPEEKFILEMHEVIRKGSKDEYIALWHPSEKAYITKFYLENKGVWSRFKELEQNLTDKKIISFFYYKKYIKVVSVAFPNKGEPYPDFQPTLVRQNNRLYITNSLSGDGGSNYISFVHAINILKKLGYIQVN